MKNKKKLLTYSLFIIVGLFVLLSFFPSYNALKNAFVFYDVTKGGNSDFHIEYISASGFGVSPYRINIYENGIVEYEAPNDIWQSSYLCKQYLKLNEVQINEFKGIVTKYSPNEKDDSNNPPSAVDIYPAKITITKRGQKFVLDGGDTYGILYDQIVDEIDPHQRWEGKSESFIQLQNRMDRLIGKKPCEEEVNLNEIFNNQKGTNLKNI